MRNARHTKEGGRSLQPTPYAVGVPCCGVLVVAAHTLGSRVWLQLPTAFDALYWMSNFAALWPAGESHLATVPRNDASSQPVRVDGV